jgi:hypothetical protein
VHSNRCYLCSPLTALLLTGVFAEKMFDSASNGTHSVIHDGKHYLRTHDTQMCYGLRAQLTIKGYRLFRS